MYLGNSNTSNPSIKRGGVTTFGGYNLTYAAQFGNKSIYWNPLVSTHYWTLNLGNLFVRIHEFEQWEHRLAKDIYL